MGVRRKSITFGKRAEKYDNGPEGRLSSEFYRMLVENMEIQEGIKMLDVGCGTGEVLYRVSKKNKIDGYGIDIEEKMVAAAKKKCPQMDIRKGVCDKLPYDDEIMDVVTSCMAYHHFDNRTGFEKEASRVLKKGGNLYIAN